MNTDHLSYILEIASCHSINQAAENLCFQRQYLSKILNNMEQQLGIAIFERHPKGVTLTKDGEYFIEQAQHIVQAADQLQQHYRQAAARYPQYEDTLTVFMPNISTPHGTVFSIIETYQQQFPHMQVSLVVKNSSSIVEAILKSPSTPGALLSPTELDEPINEAIRQIFICRLPLTVLASAHNPIAQRTQTFSLETLCQYDLAFYTADAEQTRLLFPPECRKMLEGSIKYPVNSINLFYNLLERKNCFSLAVYNQQLPDNLLQIPLAENIMVNIYLIFHQEALRSFPTKLFLNTILSYYDKPLLL